MLELWESGAERAPAPASYARVALDTPARKEFSYAVPPRLPALAVGSRVIVPFGPRRLVGVVVAVDGCPPRGVAAEKLREVVQLLDEQPLLSGPLLDLAGFIADASFCSRGNALAAMLPGALRRNRPRRTVACVEWLGDPPPPQRADFERKFPKQERALAWLKAAGGPVEVREFQARTGLSASPLSSLRRRGLVRCFRRAEQRDPFAEVAPAAAPRPEPSAAQREAAGALRDALDARRPAGFLLFGVTGSGKTEVYLQALEHSLGQGRGGIVLVPEIALTPQTVARFRGRCGPVAVLHSGLTDAERHDQWLALREGRLQVVVGARSALFAPLPALGLIVVDEEHETTFKQEATPRYHAREMALERARLEGAVCVLGSATPSLESWQAAAAGRLRLLRLPERVGGQRLPEVEIVDMRLEKSGGAHWPILSMRLRRNLDEAFARGEQAILFLNQRGFAPAWHCRRCGGSVHCGDCDVALTFHRWRKRALCHYCLKETPPPPACPRCAGELQLVGAGTERAEQTVRLAFPQARISRMDRDTMLRRESYETLLRDFGEGRIDLLLGTQMVAKGLDFPNVTVVGVLNADVALHHPDFRAAERCFNLIAQVSGRAGRGERGGRVVVQTWLPDHPAIQAAARHDYPGFAAGELPERAAFHYPPCGQALRVLVEAKDAGQAARKAAAAAADLRATAPAACEVLGPAAPPVERLRGRYRRQILIKAPGAAELRPLLPLLYELCQKQGVTVDAL